MKFNCIQYVKIFLDLHAQLKLMNHRHFKKPKQNYIVYWKIIFQFLKTNLLCPMVQYH